MEELVDSGVLGKVGTELYAEAVSSALFPNSTGIICIKTKVSNTFEVIYIVVIISWLSINIHLFKAELDMSTSFGKIDRDY